MSRRATTLAIVSLGACVVVVLLAQLANRLGTDSHTRGVRADSETGSGVRGQRVEDEEIPWVEPDVASPAGNKESAGPLEGLAERRDAATPIEGRVEDEQSGQAVVGIWVLVETEAKRSLRPVKTDDEGRFELPPQAHGKLRATLRDPTGDVSTGARDLGPWIESDDLEHEHGPVPSTWVVRAKIGPTFPLTLVPEITDQEVAGRVHETRADGSHVAWGWQRARWDSGWTLRYPSPQGIGDPDPDSRWHLEVQVAPWDTRTEERLLSGPWGGPLSMEGYRETPGIAWSGRAKLAGVRGLHPNVHVDLDAQLGLRGSVIDIRGVGIADAEVRIRSLATGSGTPAPVSHSTQDDGSFGSFPLPPGSYRVDVKHPGHAPGGLDFHLAVGSQILPPIELEQSRERGNVEGSVILRGHTTVLTVGVSLRSLGEIPYQGMQFIEVAPPEPDDLAEADSSFEPGTPRGDFQFEDVPPGPCELDLLVVPSFPYGPRPLRTECPSSGLRFEIDGSTMAHVIAFRPRDAETGAPIDRFYVHCDIGGRWMPSARRATFGGRGWAWHEGSPLRWRISAEGYRSTSGTDQQIVRSGESWIVETELQAGWTASLLFRDVAAMDKTWFDSPDDELEVFRSPPVEGVQVFADGVEVARSDPEGLAVLNLDAAPVRIEFRHPEWRLEHSDAWKDGSLEMERPPALLWMRRLPE